MRQGTAVGGSELAVSILGSWQAAPKAARDAYERFVMAVSALLGGEASSEEVPVPRALQKRCSPGIFDPALMSIDPRAASGLFEVC